MANKYCVSIYCEKDSTAWNPMAGKYVPQHEVVLETTHANLGWHHARRLFKRLLIEHIISYTFPTIFTGHKAYIPNVHGKNGVYIRIESVPGMYEERPDTRLEDQFWYNEL